MGRMILKKAGFTIVELLIVIVVIAILAAISITAYNGVQARAKNNQTQTAVAAWLKAFELYKIDNDTYPPYNSCLGTIATYPDNICDDGTGVSQAFLDEMQPYFSGTPPEPNGDVDINADSSPVRRGVLYRSSQLRLYVTLAGTQTCTGSIGGYQLIQANGYSGGTRCRIHLN